MTMEEKQKLIVDYCHGKNCNTCLLEDLMISGSTCASTKDARRLNERVKRILEEQQGNAGIIAIKDYKQCKTFKRDGDYRECKTCNAIDCPKRVRLQNTERVRRILEEQDNAGDAEPVIKDSGERTEFSTGAVRDMHTGKGRMDLVPAECIRGMYK